MWTRWTRTLRMVLQVGNIKSIALILNWPTSDTISPIATSVLPEYGFEDITGEGTFNEDTSTLLPFFASTQQSLFPVARTAPPRHLEVVPENRSQPPPPIVEIQPTEPPPMDYSEETGDNEDLPLSTESPIYPSTQMILEHLNTGQPEMPDDELLVKDCEVFERCFEHFDSRWSAQSTQCKSRRRRTSSSSSARRPQSPRPPLLTSAKTSIL